MAIVEQVEPGVDAPDDAAKARAAVVDQPAGSAAVLRDAARRPTRAAR